jgi:hypothetical protein
LPLRQFGHLSGVGDGRAENPQICSSGSCSVAIPRPRRTSKCTTLKNRGIIVSVLYIPYRPIQHPTTFANSEDFKANANFPIFRPACRTAPRPANTPADITTALNAMFNHALVTAHITN